METNGMKNSSKAGLIAGLIGVVLFIGSGAYIMGAKFAAATFETSILAQNENMKNVHSAGNNSLKMQSFALKNYSELDLKKVDALVKKYDGKPQLLMMAVRENTQGLNPQLHRDFMDAIQKYYAKWEVAQKTKISVTQEYRTYLDASIKGSIASGVFNYPTEKISKIMDEIIMSDETKTTFETGRDNVSDPFKTK